MDKKIYLKRFQSYYGTYLDILSAYRSESGWFLDNKESQIHTVPFILTTASALECSLNDHIIEYYNKSFNEENAKLLTRGLLSMTLRGKLENIVSLLTSNKYIINTNHKVYQLLIELIKLRNNLVHTKSGYELHEAFVKENDDGESYIEPDEAFLKIIDDKQNGEVDYSLGIKRNIGDYHDVLEELFELFFDIYKDKDFDGNELVLKLKTNDKDTFSLIS